MIVTGMEFLKQKLDYLADILEKADIPHQICGRGGAPAELEVYFENGAIGICQYFLADNDGTFDHYVICMETRLEAEGLSAAHGQLLCNGFNTTAVGSFALIKQGDEGIWLRGAMVEAMVCVAEENFLLFVELYESHLVKLAKMLKLQEVDG